MDGRTAAAVLGITQEATRDEIRRAFRARAKLAHPDAHGTNEAFVTLRAAADLLLATTAAAPRRPASRATFRTEPAPVSAPAPAAPTPAPVDTAPVDTAACDAGPGAAPPSGARGVVGRRAARWEHRSAACPGAAIDLTDRPTGARAHRSVPAPGPVEAAGVAFARVLDAELARR